MRVGRLASPPRPACASPCSEADARLSARPRFDGLEHLLRGRMLWVHAQHTAHQLLGEFVAAPGRVEAVAGETEAGLDDLQVALGRVRREQLRLGLLARDDLRDATSNAPDQTHSARFST